MQDALNYASRIAYSSKEVLRFTYDMAVKYRDSPGVYVECGVAAGAQIIAMAAGAPNKTIYAFDSFEGIPFPSNRDDQMPGIRKLEDWERRVLPEPGHALLESTGATSVSVSDFIDHTFNALGKKSLNIHIVKGWFENTLPDFITYNNDDISILRLDGDLYNSTYVCLKHLYPKVIEGGLVIIDDWALLGCRDAVYTYFTLMKDVYKWPLDMEYIKNENSTVAYWTK